ncbi:MAG TPA: ABC transporter permease, partial [Candidatus Binataceae bacterium]|nr:ABC transporter permease [Candidatus Binataceae bacterium]
MRYELQIALRYLRSRRRDAFISVTTLFTAIGVTIGVAALIITLSVMNGFQESLRSRVLALSPQVQVVSSEGSITNYHTLQEKIAPVPKISGTDAFVVGQAMLSSGRAVGGVIVRGVEPENPTVLSQWSRYMTDGSFHDLVPPPVPSGTSLNPVAIGVTLAS